MNYIKYVLIAGYIGIGALFLAVPVIDILKTVFEYIPAILALVMELISAIYLIMVVFKLIALKRDKSGKAIDEERDKQIKRYYLFIIGLAVQIGALIYAYQFYMDGMNLHLF